jgi:hypothetical protein
VAIAVEGKVDDIRDCCARRRTSGIVPSTSRIARQRNENGYSMINA